MRQRLTSDDFFTGLFSALALKGCRTLTIRSQRFDRAIAGIVDALMTRAPAQGIDVRFRVRLHPVHGDSETIRDSITLAAQRDLISLDNPEYQDVRLKVTPEDANAFLAQLPGGVELFGQIADEFLHSYS